MGKNNIQLYNLAKSYLGQGGRTFRNYCGLPSGAAWCAAFVTYIFAKGGDASLFYGGKKVVYVPFAESWMRANLAQIPIFLAMPMDVITFDWNLNGTPDHIGFVRDRKSDTEIYTIEGNTSGGIVANKVRPAKYISGVFRPQFAPSSSWTTTKPLVIDGQFGYSSIACLQKALGIKIDAVLGKQTVKALQKRCGVAQDGSWGTKTSKAVQKMIGIKADGWFGVNSVKALQRWINKQNGVKTATAKATPKVQTTQDKMCAWAKQICDSGKYHYKVYTDDPNTHLCPICHPGSGNGWNCIGYAVACWRHGGGIPCRCSCEVINNSMGEKMLRSNHETASKLAKECLGITQIQVISNGGKTIPASSLKKGDLILYFEGSTYTHLALYIGNGQITDSSRGHTPQVKYGVPYAYPDYGVCKLAIRYTGK